MSGGVNWYSYCNNNPLSFKDPTGLKVIVLGSKEFQNETLSSLQKLTRDTLSIDKNGVLIIKKNDNEKNLNNGTSLIRDLSAHKETINIKETKEGNGYSPQNLTKATNGTGSSGTVFYNPQSNPGILTTDSSTGRAIEKSRPPEIGLAHELIHALHGVDGTIDTSTRVHTYTDINGNTKENSAMKEEFRTVGNKYNSSGDITENKIRKEHKLEDRATY